MYLPGLRWAGILTTSRTENPLQSTPSAPLTAGFQTHAHTTHAQAPERGQKVGVASACRTGCQKHGQQTQTSNKGNLPPDGPHRSTLSLGTAARRQSSRHTRREERRDARALVAVRLRVGDLVAAGAVAAGGLRARPARLAVAVRVKVALFGLQERANTHVSAHRALATAQG